ncbi:MAG: 4-alpha-glucanotransferase [Campylobacterota bacterium]|nr:4-alpha-glucanotransferase [Campylobacterota bacterium]
MSNYKGVKFAVHFSGWLLEYIKKNDKELFSLMQKMAKNNQIEFFSGGYYEPILASIPSRDRVDQIKKLNDFIESNFNQTPLGLWLTERVWDSSIISDIISCGIKFVVVDDYHFISAGFDKDKLAGYYLTEENGESLGVFPINKTLRYIVPFKESKGVVSHIESIASDNGDAAILFDDGEKFGIWPKTYEWVYEKGWLDEFASSLEKSQKIESVHYKDYFLQQKPLGIAYLPTCSYYEMGEWSLQGHDGIIIEEIKNHLKEMDETTVNKFVKGSIWKNFFVKYPESNRIHKRFIELSKERKKINKKAYDENLFKAQTNDVLWHGIFGGLYLPNLRDNAYRFIIECENIRYKENSALVVGDYNFDGYEELKAVRKKYIAIFESKNGAQMSEFDLRESKFNLQNTLTRYKESYHEKIINPKEAKAEHSDGIDTIHNISVENLEEYIEHIINDWYTKNSFIDHIVDDSFDIKSFQKCNFREFGDFVNQPFEMNQISSKEVVFKRDGGIYEGAQKTAVLIKKSFVFEDDSIEFGIEILKEKKVDFSHLMEMNFHFADLKSVFFNGKIIEDTIEFKEAKILEIKDSYTKTIILIVFDNPCDVFCYKLNTVSQSESGFDLTNQGITIGFKNSIKDKNLITGRLKIGE